MEAKRDFTNWQEMLSYLIKTPGEKLRLARAVDVSPVTLKRWTSGKSQPREENVRQLIRALAPDVAARFRRLFDAEFPTFSHETVAREPLLAEISSQIYAQVMQIHAFTPHILLDEALYTCIFEHALDQLDPDRVGMSLALVGCVPPRPGQKVRSLRQLRGMGTPPWTRNLERKTLFLGSEAVVGSAVMHYRAVGVSSRDAFSFTSAHWTDYEQSAIASPILRQARVAGALLASSVQPNYFTSVHQTLLDLYACLAVLLFDPTEFYPATEIDLRVMPAQARQLTYLAQFEQRVALKFEDAHSQNGSLTLQKAHQCVWQDIEEELLHLPIGE